MVNIGLENRKKSLQKMPVLPAINDANKFRSCCGRWNKNSRLFLIWPWNYSPSAGGHSCGASFCTAGSVRKRMMRQYNVGVAMSEKSIEMQSAPMILMASGRSMSAP